MDLYSSLFNIAIQEMYEMVTIYRDI